MLAKTLDVPVVEFFGKYSGDAALGVKSLDDELLRGRTAGSLVRRVLSLDDDARAVVVSVIDGLVKMSRPRRRRSRRAG